MGTTLTALARASGVAGGWEVSGWGGALHEDVSGLALANVRDGSVLFAPGVTYSAADEASVRAGMFAGLGRKTDCAAPSDHESALVVRRQH